MNIITAVILFGVVGLLLGNIFIFYDSLKHEDKEVSKLFYFCTHDLKGTYVFPYGSFNYKGNYCVMSDGKELSLDGVDWNYVDKKRAEGFYNKTYTMEIFYNSSVDSIVNPTSSKTCTFNEAEYCNDTFRNGYFTACNHSYRCIKHKDSVEIWS